MAEYINPTFVPAVPPLFLFVTLLLLPWGLEMPFVVKVIMKVNFQHASKFNPLTLTKKLIL